jgi:two-component system, NtrC family, response regulator AtoC
VRILVVDDDRSILRTLSLHLAPAHDVTTAPSLAEARARAVSARPELIVLDLKLPDGTGLDLLKSLRSSGDHTPVLLVTGHGDLESAIDAMREGAADYIRKPIDIDELDAAVARVARSSGGAGEGGLVLRDGPPRPGHLVGKSRPMLALLKRVGLAARSRVTVLITGESGTGKDLVARTIHAHSTPDEPFVAVNCSAIVPTLLESELFGHARGAFTGAVADKAGRLEAAQGGTVFLDEVGDLPLDLQSKLLRVLQEREFERVGAAEPIPLRARVLTATHRDLEAMVAVGTFREDLYFRLAVDPLRVPSLRERIEDLPDLVEHVLLRVCPELGKSIRRVAAADLERLAAYPWPGNVRELENVLTGAALATAGETLDLSGWTPRGPAAPAQPAEDAPFPTLAESERAQVEKALESTGWNITRASGLLGISRPTLRKKIADFGLVEPGQK